MPAPNSVAFRKLSLREVFSEADVDFLRLMARDWTAEGAISRAHPESVDPERGGIWQQNAEACDRQAQAATGLADRIEGLLSLSPK